jgi:DNA helicase-2/ATP-dependent DNA helicase PcrA
MKGLSCRPVTAEEAAICDREANLLSAVREAITAARSAARRPSGSFALASLRDAFAEAGEADRPAVLAQMAQEAARREALRPRSLPDLAAPYFGHMRLRSAGRSRDVLLGDRPFVDADRGVLIIDWRRAPLAEVFFACDPGDEYEIEAGDRTISGVLEERHVIALQDGELSAVSVEEGSLRRDKNRWVYENGGLVPSLAVPDSGGSDRRAFRLAGLLDKTQAALLDRDPSLPLLVLGSAGCGKTTVALHRAAALYHLDPKRFSPERSLVVVPEPGLRRFAERILVDLGVPCILDEDAAGAPKSKRATVRTFDDWIRSEARRVFPWLPDRESPDPPFAVSRLKRHPGMLAAIDRLIDDLAKAAADRLDRWMNGHGAIASAVLSCSEPILADRLRCAEGTLLKSAPPARRSAIKEAFREERRRLTRVRADHLRLVGDRELLSLAVRASNGELPMGLVEEVAEHTGRQLDEPSEIRFAHVDPDRLATLDGRSLDDGTPEAVAGTVDLEDYALLLEILWRKTGRSKTRAGELSTYAHLVLDEAQELTPVELRVLGRAVDPSGGSITVAGDAAQRIDRSGYFSSWESAMAALGTRASPAYLETSYRCPAPIVEFAQAVLGPEAPFQKPRATRGGAPVLRSRLPGEGPSAAVLVHALRDLVRRDPAAGVAVLARDATAARALHEVLSRALPARLVEDGDFAFGPGVEVTEVAHVKGLEFDYVIVPDADAKSYPDTPESRRLLHVAATRASRRLWIISPAGPSPTLCN